MHRSTVLLLILLAGCNRGSGANGSADGTGSGATEPTGGSADGPTDPDATAPDSTAETGTPGPPSVTVGDPITITWPVDRTVLDASASAGATVTWTQLDGPADSTLRIDTDESTVATALRIGDFGFRATATDGDGETASADLLVHVLPPELEPATPIDWAQALPRPIAHPAHTLAPLTRWTGMHVLEFHRVMAERYGYALDLGDTSEGWDGDFANPNGTIAQKIALKATDPAIYKLSIMVYRPLVWSADQFSDEFPDMWLDDAQGQPTGYFSPEAPLELMDAVADASVPRLELIVAKVAEEVPESPYIDVVLNGGEYGLGVWGDDDALWLADARVRSAIEDRFGLAAGTMPSEDQLFTYVSERKAAQEQIITDAHVAANPGGMYVYYPTWSVGWKERWWGWWRYAWDYPLVRTLSYPPALGMGSIYYRDYVSQDTGWTGDKDSLSQLTNAFAWQSEQGAPLQYISTCGGWPHDGHGFGRESVIATDESYMGYLKTAYVVGLTGAVAGYFAAPTACGWGCEDTDVSTTMPNWVRQLVTLGEVQALFSHLEGFLRDGTVLAGPRQHVWSTDKPAYELDASVGGAPDPGVRVVARIDAGGSRWLVALWAVAGGDREVEVAIDGLGTASLVAREAGSVYVLAADETLLLDTDPMLPTDTLLASDVW